MKNTTGKINNTKNNLILIFVKLALVLIIIPSISLIIYNSGTKWVSSASISFETPLADFSKDSNDLIDLIEKTTGFHINEHQKKYTKKDKLEALDALQNALAIFLTGFFSISFIIINFLWLPVFGALKGVFLGSWKIIGLSFQGFMVGTITVLSGAGLLYLFYIWIWTFFTESYSPGFFIVWMSVGFISIFSGIILSLALYFYIFKYVFKGDSIGFNIFIVIAVETIIGALALIYLFISEFIHKVSF